MKLALEDFLQDQLRRPIQPQLLVDTGRTVEVFRPLTWRNREYLPADPRLGRLAATLEVPASIAKTWMSEHKARVLGTGYTDGVWDCYELGPEKLPGYRPWSLRRTSHRPSARVTCGL
jgi:hypothetical protein